MRIIQWRLRSNYSLFPVIQGVKEVVELYIIQCLEWNVVEVAGESDDPGGYLWKCKQNKHSFPRSVVLALSGASYGSRLAKWQVAGGFSSHSVALAENTNIATFAVLPSNP